MEKSLDFCKKSLRKTLTKKAEAWGPGGPASSLSEDEDDESESEFAANHFDILS